MTTDIDLQRAYDELVQVCQRYEIENQKLRELLKNRLPAPTPVVLAKPATKPAAPTVGNFVEYVDSRGLPHLALVLEQRNGKLRLKVYRTAQPDLVLDSPRAEHPEQKNCWRGRKSAAL